MRQQARQSIQSVARASRMLLAIANSREGLTATQLATDFGLTLSTAYHLLSTLEDEGLLAKSSDKRYLLGRAAVDIANSPGLRAGIDPQHRVGLRHLAEATSETAYLTGWFRGEIQILATVEGSQAVRVAGLQVGYSGSVHARASSKLLLAYAEDELRAAAIDECDFAPYTTRTLTDRGRLEEELQTIRQAGLAFDRGEYREGVRSASIPLHRDGTVVAALAVSAPAERFERAEPALIDALRSSAAIAQSHLKAE